LGSHNIGNDEVPNVYGIEGAEEKADFHGNVFAVKVGVYPFAARPFCALKFKTFYLKFVATRRTIYLRTGGVGRLLIG
jgi:hypothetical protein